uniref:TsaA-like domain-containing protein n=1 Tax=Aegilops tauschii subsp. strangulata TaxID=200361 RepID=A0A453KVZ6_AEGTS
RVWAATPTVLTGLCVLGNKKTPRHGAFAEPRRPRRGGGGRRPRRQFAGLLHKRKCGRLTARLRELEDSLADAVEKAAAERRGRVRAQQSLRRALSEQGASPDKGKPATAPASYPMAPIGTVESCFSTRNGTPRQPLVVPLARATVVLNPARVAAEALEGLASYSHCWILYVFHLNTDLDKMWKDPARSKLKAKVRVPRLKGGKMGVLATRTPHRPNPIGLSVAKVEAVDGHAILLSGVDLVDGTPVLDIKPYLPYSDSVEGATIPNWLEVDGALAVESIHFSEHFISSLSNCWAHVQKQALYASADEFQDLIKEVLSWDIRSLSQRLRPHQVTIESKADDCGSKADKDCRNKEDYQAADSCSIVVYHLHLEGIDVSYKIDENSNIIVDNAALLPSAANQNRNKLSMLSKGKKLKQLQ